MQIGVAGFQVTPRNELLVVLPSLSRWQPSRLSTALLPSLISQYFIFRLLDFNNLLTKNWK